MSQIGSETAKTIVNTDTLTLIERANIIVIGCTGTNCNVSDSTRRIIKQELSTLSQEQSNATLTLLSLTPSSTLSRNINDAYINLGAAVSSVYNFQCGNITVNATNCVTNASSVQIAQNNLESLLVQPATNEINHIVVLSILFIVAMIAFLLFFIFLLIGLIEGIIEIPLSSQPNMLYNQPNITFNQHNIPYSHPNMTFNQPNIPYSQPNIPYSQPNIPYSQPNMTFNQPNTPYSQLNIPVDQSGVQLDQSNMSVNQSNYYDSPKMAIIDDKKIPVPVSPFNTTESIYK